MLLKTFVIQESWLNYADFTGLIYIGFYDVKIICQVMEKNRQLRQRLYIINTVD